MQKCTLVKISAGGHQYFLIKQIEIINLARARNFLQKTNPNIYFPIVCKHIYACISRDINS